jgi:hypothetical protein
VLCAEGGQRLLALALGRGLRVLAARGSLGEGLVARHEGQRQLLAQARELAVGRLVAFRGGRAVPSRALAGLDLCLDRLASGLTVRRHDHGAHGLTLTRRRLLHERQRVQQLHDLTASRDGRAHRELGHHGDVAQS